MWILRSLPSANTLNSIWLPVVLLVTLAIGLRALPEILAYPYPIGYDVVNYYIPVVTELPGNWQFISDDFPIYSLILFFVALVTGIPVPSVVVGVAIAVFGLFAFSVNFLGRTLLKLGAWQSAFVAIFVIVQLAVLRTAWDLHRDMLALAVMFVIFGLISTRKNDLITLFILVGLCCLTVASDRMIGLLLSLSLIAVAAFKQRRDLIILASVSSALFMSLMIPEILTEGRSEGINISPILPESAAAALDYLVLFGILNGIIAIPAILGLLKLRNILMVVPFTICGLGALSWVFFQDPSALVPERWTILFGIFASIPAGYFIAINIWRHKNHAILAGGILAGFGVLAVGYAAMPYENPIFVMALTRNHIEEFMPVTMQFNALDVDDNEQILAAIDRINSDTEEDAVIVGAKHWRGFMQLGLDDDRTYEFSENSRSLAQAYSDLDKHVYLFEPAEDGSKFNLEKIEDSGRR